MGYKLDNLGKYKLVNISSTQLQSLSYNFNEFDIIFMVFGPTRANNTNVQNKFTCCYFPKIQSSITFESHAPNEYGCYLDCNMNGFSIRNATNVKGYVWSTIGLKLN